MKFENRNLIVLGSRLQWQFDTFEELIEQYFGEDYEEKSDEDKLRERYMKMYPYSLLNRKRVCIDVATGFAGGEFVEIEEQGIEDKLFIGNEKDFFLSLCMLDELKILERKDSNIFTGNLNKMNMQGNYVLVNAYAEQLLKREFMMLEKGER